MDERFLMEPNAVTVLVADHTILIDRAWNWKN
jgi:hypothetical protein